jgi:hypothetical protein
VPFFGAISSVSKKHTDLTPSCVVFRLYHPPFVRRNLLRFDLNARRVFAIARVSVGSVTSSCDLPCLGKGHFCEIEAAIMRGKSSRRFALVAAFFGSAARKGEPWRRPPVPRWVASLFGFLYGRTIQIVRGP